MRKLHRFERESRVRRIKRSNEDLNRHVRGNRIETAQDLAYALCAIADTNQRPKDLLGNWSTFVKADLCYFPVWCFTDRDGKVTFGVCKLKNYAREVDDDFIDDTIVTGDIDDSFTRNGVKELAQIAVATVIEDEQAYEMTFTSQDGMELTLPCTEEDIYTLLDRADTRFADITDEMVDELTDGICKKLGIGAWNDDFGIIRDDYEESRRPNVRNNRSVRNSRRLSRNEASMGEVADDAAARRYAEVDPKHCSKDEFMSRIQRGDLFIGRYYGTKYYFKVTGFRGGRVVLSSIGEKASGKLVPGVSEPLYMPDPSSRGSQKDAHAQPIKTYSGIELTSRDWSFEMWDGKWDFQDINGGLGF